MKFLLCSLFLFSMAVADSNMYTATFPVQSSVQKVSAQLARRALIQVLIKVTGNANLLCDYQLNALPDDSLASQCKVSKSDDDQDQSDAALQNNQVSELLTNQVLVQKTLRDLLKHAPQLVQNFTVSQGLLLVQLNQQVISRALEKMMLPIWVGKRPSFLVWGVLSQQARLFVGNNPIVTAQSKLTTAGSTTLSKLLSDSATRYGIHLTLPLFDLTDLQIISKDQIWKFDVKKVLLASQRYQSVHVLFLRLYPLAGNNQWQGQWVEYKKGVQVAIGKQSGRNPQEVLDRLFGHLLSDMAPSHVQVLSDNVAKPVSLVVHGVGDLSAYTNILTYLKKIKAIRKVDVGQIGNQQLQLRLLVLGGMNRLTHLLTADDHFQLQSLPVAGHGDVTSGANSGELNSDVADLGKQHQDVLDVLWHNS